MTTLIRRLLDLVRRPFQPREPYVTSAVHCVNCGHSYVAVIPASSPNYYADLGVLDMLECSECGLYTVCSS
jgi:hypothetical protein